MQFKKPLLFGALASLFSLPLLSGCVYDEHDHHARDHWRDNDWRDHNARPAGYRDRDRDGVPDRWEHGRDRW